MRAFNTVLLASVLTLSSVAAWADVATATCNDGSSWTGTSTSHRGACSHHGGVQAYSTQKVDDTTSDVKSSANSAASSAGSAISNTADKAQASVEGTAGQVWVNTNSKVYHCSGDRDYGHTKVGKYMSESAAKAEGDRPSRGKTCS